MANQATEYLRYLLKKYSEDDKIIDEEGKKKKKGTNWRVSQKYLRPAQASEKFPPGCINISPGWFSQGRTVSFI